MDTSIDSLEDKSMDVVGIAAAAAALVAGIAAAALGFDTGVVALVVDTGVVAADTGLAVGIVVVEGIDPVVAGNLT